ncbi:MAG: alpha/beta fold hydrolase [Arenicellales bacterium WSBS_2016_MAG_OTU3]
MTKPPDSDSSAAEVCKEKWPSSGTDRPEEFEALFAKAMEIYSDFAEAIRPGQLETIWKNVAAFSQTMAQETVTHNIEMAREMTAVLKHAHADFEHQIDSTTAKFDTRQIFDLWIDCCERAYQQRAGTDEFCNRLAAFVNDCFSKNAAQKIDLPAPIRTHATAAEAGASKRALVFEQDGIKLYRYQATQKTKTKKQPLLIVYALINRPYMMDLQPGKSIIANLLAQNLDVYLIDWGYPKQENKTRSLNDHINVYLHNCVEQVCRLTHSRKTSLLGVCQGGTFSLCYTAMHPEKIKRLITMVTPVDFHREEFLLSRWVQKIDVDAITDQFGNIPGQLLNQAFIALQPFRLALQKYAHLFANTQDEVKLQNFMRMEKWIFDSPDQCGQTFREFVQLFFKQNSLFKDELYIDQIKVSLSNINGCRPLVLPRTIIWYHPLRPRRLHHC